MMNNNLTQQTEHLKTVKLAMKPRAINTLVNLKEKPWINRVKKIILNWQTRKDLRTLSKLQMKDIGITASDIANEINKPWWK